MHIKNLLANSAIQNMLSQQNSGNTNHANPVAMNCNTTTSIGGNNGGEQTAKIRKRKNNSISSSLKLNAQQKENSNNAVTVNVANNNEANAMRLFEQFKSLGLLQMCQPEPNLSAFSISYPGKQHSILLEKSNRIRGKCYNVEVEHLNNQQTYQIDKHFIDSILSESGIFNQEVKQHLPVGDTKANHNHQDVQPLNPTKKLNSKEVKNCFKICTAKIEKPLAPLAEIDKNQLLKDSNHRLRDLLEQDQHGSQENLVNMISESDSNMDSDNAAASGHNEYLKKSLKTEPLDDEYEENVKSPVIALADSSIKPELDAAISLTNACKENNTTATTTSITLKLSRHASKNIRNTILKISDLMLMSCPSTWDLGRLVKINNYDIENNKPKPALLSIDSGNENNANKPLVEAAQLTKPVETGFTIQNLISSIEFKCCKFCESYLIDGAHFKIKSDSVQDNEERPAFCSQFCEDSYKKYLGLKQIYLKKQAETKLELERNVNKSLEYQSSCRVAIRWHPNISLDRVNKPTSDSKPQQTFEVLKPSCADKRVCMFCNLIGDLDNNGPSRLLTMDVGKWCHLNCALWSNEVYETMAGALINVETAYKQSMSIECCFCHQRGGSIKCFMQKCTNYYHLPCALKDKCSFNQDKVI